MGMPNSQRYPFILDLILWKKTSFSSLKSDSLQQIPPFFSLKSDSLQQIPPFSSLKSDSLQQIPPFFRPKVTFKKTHD